MRGYGVLGERSTEGERLTAGAGDGERVDLGRRVRPDLDEAGLGGHGAAGDAGPQQTLGQVAAADLVQGDRCTDRRRPGECGAAGQ